MDESLINLALMQILKALSVWSSSLSQIDFSLLSFCLLGVQINLQHARTHPRLKLFLKAAEMK